jgi:hypothetical protein
MKHGRLIAALMVAPMLCLGTGITQQVHARAASVAQGSEPAAPHPPQFARYTIDTDGIR